MTKRRTSAESVSEMLDNNPDIAQDPRLTRHLKREIKRNLRNNKRNPNSAANVVSLDGGAVRPRKVERPQPFPFQIPYTEALMDQDIPAVVCTGIWGSGKTKMAIHAGAYMFDNGVYDKIIIARPSKAGENNIGFEPGSKNEKLLGWNTPVLEELYSLFGRVSVEKKITSGEIEILNLDQVKGRTFVNSFVLIDEVEDLNFPDFKCLIARPGEGSKIVLTGDHKQVDRKIKTVSSGKFSGLSGLQTLEAVLDARPSLREFIHVFKFTDWETECVRSGLAKEWGISLTELGLL